MESASKNESTVIPLVRERPVLHGIIGSQERRLSVPFLRERLSTFLAGSASVAEAALCVVSILQQVVLHESGRYQFDEGLDETLHQLSANGVVSEAFRSLYFRSKNILHDTLAKKEVEQDAGPALLEDALQVLEWYGERTASLTKITTEDQFSRPGSEGIFDFKILHDRERSGVFGCEIKVGVLLDSHGGKTLWLRAQAMFRGKWLQARQGWESWTSQDGTGDFAVEIPLYCKDIKRIGRTIVDSASLFIPYDAVDWPEDLHGKSADASIVIGVFAQDGEKIFSQSFLEALRVLPPSMETRAMHSPQALEIWSTCPVQGHTINRLQMFWTEDSLSQGGGKIDISFDAVLFGFAGKEVSVTLRILDEDGNGIQCLQYQNSDSRGAYCTEYILGVSHAIARWNGLSSVINPGDLVLEDGENDLLLEISLNDSEGRTLCGIVEPFSIRYK